MLESLNSNILEYQRLSKDEMQKRGILGRLTGICADIINPTRNDRKYSEKLWENVFNNPIMKERIENKVCYGELGHPVDREETDMEKVAVCMAEVPKKGKDGKLRAVFDILDTPNGRLLKSLCDYGSILGVSSRGSGDLETDWEGNESVNPNTYNCEGFDIVLIPAVKEARLEYVNESLSRTRYNKTLKDKLTESISKEDDAKQKIMLESLDTLGIELDEDDTKETGVNISENLDDSKQLKTNSTSTVNDTTEDMIELSESNLEDLDINDKDINTDIAANDDGAVVKELQEALNLNRKLDNKIVSLQEKLSVCYAKEVELKEEIEKQKSQIGKLSKLSITVKALNEKLVSAHNQQNDMSNECKSLNDSIFGKDNQIKQLSESVEKHIQKNKSIRNEANEKIGTLNTRVKTLRENLNTVNNELTSLQEKYDELNKNYNQSKDHYSKQLEHQNKLIEKYKNIAVKSVDRYIESQAVRLGVKSNEIKNRLPESYSFSDIDSICEDLQEYKLNMSSLPFNMNGTQLTEGMKLKGKNMSQKTLVPIEEDIDDLTIALANSFYTK